MQKFDLNKLPKRHRAVLENPEALKRTKALIEGQLWLSSDNPFWLLIGSVGVGKTIAAFQTAIQAYETLELTNETGLKFKPTDFVYTKARDLVQSTLGYEPDAKKLFKDSKKTWLLIIDELGVEYFKEPGYWFSMLDELIDYRYERELKTIIVSNESLQQLLNRYPERMMDRIRADAVCTEAFGQSLRGSTNYRKGVSK